MCSCRCGDVYSHKSWYATVLEHAAMTSDVTQMKGLLSTGAQGVLDAGLVPLCVEKLVQEDSTELKVCF